MKRLRILVLSLSMAGICLPVHAALVTLNWDITVGNQGTTVVNVGDTVRWNVTSGTHTVDSTGPDTFTDSGTLTSGQIYDVLFSSPGSYGYVCGFHPSMLGTISVVAPSPTATPTPTPSQTATPSFTVTPADPNPSECGTLPQVLPTPVTTWSTAGVPAFAKQVTAPEPLRVTSLGVQLFAVSGGQTFRLGLYSDSGGVPGALLAQVGPIDVGSAYSGWSDSVLPVSVDLAAGNYWIAVMASGPFVSFEIINEAFSVSDLGVYQPFPASWSQTGTPTSGPNLRAGHCPVFLLTNSPTPTPTFSHSPTRTASPTSTSSSTPTFTVTPTHSFSFTITATPTTTPTATPSLTRETTPCTTQDDAYSGGDASGSSAGAPVLFTYLDYPGCMWVSDSSDWYQFVLATSGNLDVYLTPNPYADFNLRLWNESLSVIGTSITAGPGQEVISLTGMTPGTYYLEVIHGGGLSNMGIYSIRVEGPGVPTLTPSPTFTMTPTPSLTLTPTYRASSLGKAVLAPVPAGKDEPVCMYFDSTPASSMWDVFNAAGEKVAHLEFEGQGDHCWDHQGLAAGIYYVVGQNKDTQAAKKTWRQIVILTSD